MAKILHTAWQLIKGALTLDIVGENEATIRLFPTIWNVFIREIHWRNNSLCRLMSDAIHASGRSTLPNKASVSLEDGIVSIDHGISGIEDN